VWVLKGCRLFNLLEKKEIAQMTSLIKHGLGLLALMAITLMIATGARGDDVSAGTQPPVAPGQNAGTASPKTATHPSHEQMAREMEEEPCQSMPGTGMPRMGMGPTANPRPGMPGMGMRRMGAPGEPMPGMEMPGMEMMGMPMMHPQMMMRMMARNPRLAGKMLQMRADIMRALADVLTKYGKQMESGQWPATPDKGVGDD
jgi:hypothetical protein